MPTPTTYPSQLTYAGVAPETVQGTPVGPTSTLLLTKDPSTKDNVTMLEDMGLRNAMPDVYGAVPGPAVSDFQLDGDARADTQGYLLGNILGDWTASGTTTTPTTTLSSTAAAGANQISTAATISAATTIQIGTGLTAEVFVTGTPSGSGPYTIPLANTSGIKGNGTLAFQHASGQTVTAITNPMTYKFSVQNAGTSQSQSLLAQAHSLTLTDWYGPTAVTGARAYPGCMLSDITYTIDPSKLFSFSAKGTGWKSAAAASTPPVVVSGLSPLAGWQFQVGVGGPASGGTLLSNVTALSLTITRALKPYPTVSGSQNPFIIRQGKVGVTGKLTFIAVDESPLVNYLTNVQPQLQIVITNGSGATTQNITFDMQQVYYKAVPPGRANEAVEFDVDFVALANTTNVGASGGFSPLMVTVQNAVAVGTY